MIFEDCSKELGDILEVYVQPVFESRKFELVKAEALIRTNKNTSGLWCNSAEHPFKIIEKNNWYRELDEFVLCNICNFIYSNKGKLLNPISVNLCKETIEMPFIADRILAIINNYNIDKKMISLEINERTNFKSGAVAENLKRLEDNNIDLMLDDFGFGDTSLLVIGSHKINTVKIDKNFLNILDSRRINVIREIIGMLKRLNIDIIVEGVENKEQLDITREIGDCSIQGFLLSKPVELNEFIRKYK